MKGERGECGKIRRDRAKLREKQSKDVGKKTRSKKGREEERGGDATSFASICDVLRLVCELVM